MDTCIGLFEFLVEAELQHYYDPIKTDLKILKTSQLKYVTDEDLAQLGMSRPEQRRLKKFYTKYYPQNYLSRIKKLLGPGKKDENSVALGALSEEKAQDFQTGMSTDIVARVTNKHIIPAESITVNKELGVGEFGVVQQGVWTNDGHRIQVAIKCLCRERMHSNSMEFLKEAAIMHSIEHKSIVRLYGVVLHPDSLMLVTELAPLRSLLECLKEIALRPSFPVLTLCDFGVQICEGMTYLENKRLIHRDLAARNILVFTKNKVKISDFGLSRALGVGKDYYQTNFNVNLKLPIAWCAPECISYLRFTSASDVWAYAVTLWEMFSYGFQPWAAFSGHQILVAIDAPNLQRLEQPECCPKEYFTLMQKCWQHEPNKRPKFSEILTLLPDCKPEQVQAVSPSDMDSTAKRPDHLTYRSGDIITVLDKGSNGNSTQWKGILSNGTTGLFNPLNIVSYLGPSLPSSGTQNVFVRSSLPNESPGSSIRNSLIRSDRDRSTSKRRLRSDMISGPQGEVKHTGHVGLDGAYFGDVSFLEYNHLPRQVVTPYKPSEDLEQTPLINPNSPSHLTGNNPPPNVLSSHPILLRETNPMATYQTSEEAGGQPSEDISAGARYGNSSSSQGKNQGSSNFNVNFDSLSLQKHVSKVKWPGGKKNSKKLLIGNACATAKSFNQMNEDYNTNECDVDGEETQQHEYQEISDDEDDQKPSDFGQSLLDEMESLFRSLGGPNKIPGVPVHHDHEGNNHRNELTELSSRLSHTASMSKKKQSAVKPISAHDQRMLDSAIALANELTARSMTDLDHNEPPQTPTTPNERSKFSFRFPLTGASTGNNPSGTLRSGEGSLKVNDASGNREKRNFSQEAQSVPDIQSSLSEESKMAYESLVEQPARLVTTLMKIRHKQSAPLPRKPPNIQIAPLNDIPHMNTLECTTKKNEAQGDPENQTPSVERSNIDDDEELASPDILTAGYINNLTIDDKTDTTEDAINILPLPPRDRSQKPQNLRKRHTRKYPLIIQDSNLQRTLNRINQPTVMDDNIQDSPKKNAFSGYLNPKGKSDLITYEKPSDCVLSTRSSSKPSHYQNLISDFAYSNEDSFDTASLKFEAEMEKEFTSVDCCDGIVSDFECDSNLLLKTHTTENNDTEKSQRCEKAKLDIIEGPSRSFDANTDADIDYIDSSHCSNPFVIKPKEPIKKSINPFSSPNSSSKRTSFPLIQPSNELSSNALFNKIKTDLLTQDFQNETIESKLSSSTMESLDVACGTLALTGSSLKKNPLETHSAEWSKQRRSIGENLSSIESQMLTKGSPDRVSIEDLLEFADQKPCGRQRGTESDEVRIMCKVLNQQVSPETCLLTLEFASWNVHRAIKLARLRSMGIDEPTLYECSAALDSCGWDIAKAAALLAAHHDAADITQV